MPTEQSKILNFQYQSIDEFYEVPRHKQEMFHLDDESEDGQLGRHSEKSSKITNALATGQIMNLIDDKEKADLDIYTIVNGVLIEPMWFFLWKI